MKEIKVGRNLTTQMGAGSAVLIRPPVFCDVRLTFPCRLWGCLHSAFCLCDSQHSNGLYIRDFNISPSEAGPLCYNVRYL